MLTDPRVALRPVRVYHHRLELAPELVARDPLWIHLVGLALRTAALCSTAIGIIYGVVALVGR